MRPLHLIIAAACAAAAGAVFAQTPAPLKPYIKEDSPVLVLNHIRVIDGTGALPAEDQRIEIEGGKVTRVQSAKLKNAYPTHARVLDLTGKAVIPGLVGMHEHLFYTTPERRKEGLLLFGDGVGYDPVKLTDSVQGLMGLR